MQDRNVENIKIRQNVKTRDGTQHTAQVKHILSIQNHGCWAGVERFRTFGSEVGVVVVQHDYVLPHDTGDVDSSKPQAENVLRVV